MIKISPFTPLFFHPSTDAYGIESKYMQTFSPDDTILIEVITTAGEAVSGYLRNAVTEEATALVFTQIVVSAEIKAYYAKVTGRKQGCYTVEVCGQRSEIFRISSDIEATTLIRYTNSSANTRQDCIFFDKEKQLVFEWRVPGGFKDDDWAFGINNEQFEMADGNIVELFAVESTQKSFTMGYAEGCPMWFGDMLNRVLCCSHVHFNGTRYVRKGSAVPEATKVSDNHKSYTFKVQLQGMVEGLDVDFPFDESSGSTGGGEGYVYLIKLNDTTTPTDSNTFSSLRIMLEIENAIKDKLKVSDDLYLRKDQEDTAQEIINFIKGIRVGRSKDIAVGVDERGDTFGLFDKVTARKNEVNIGNAQLVWDDANKVLRLMSRDGEMAHFLATGDVVCYGKKNDVPTPSQGGSLEEMYDVELTNPVNGESLVYDGTKWVNKMVESGGGGLSVFTVKVGDVSYSSVNGVVSLPTPVGKRYGDGEIFNDYNFSEVSRMYAHSEGYGNYALGATSHTEGMENLATGSDSHAEGHTAQNIYLKGAAGAKEYEIIKGMFKTAFEADLLRYKIDKDCYVYYNTQQLVFARVLSTRVDGNRFFITLDKTLDAHNEVNDTGSCNKKLFMPARGRGSHVEGGGNSAYGMFSHAECGVTSAYGDYSHSEGVYTLAIGYGSHADGVGTVARNKAEHASGLYNVSNANTLYSIGFGSTSQRKNVFEVTDTGSIYCNGIGGFDGTNRAAAHSLSYEMYHHTHSQYLTASSIYTAAQCTTYTTDSGATTPAAVKKAFTLFNAVSSSGLYEPAIETVWKPNYNGTNVSNPTWLVGWDVTNKQLTAVNRSTLNVNYAEKAGNADTVDGYHANAFAPAIHYHDDRYVNSTGDTMTGSLTMSGANIELGTNWLDGYNGHGIAMMDSEFNTHIGSTYDDPVAKKYAKVTIRSKRLAAKEIDSEWIACSYRHSLTGEFSMKSAPVAIASKKLAAGYNYILGWGDTCPSGYDTAYGIGTYRTSSGWGSMLFEVCNYEGGKARLAQLEIKGAENKLWFSGNLLVAGQVTQHSDARLKKNIRPLVLKDNGFVEPKEFEFIRDDKPNMGFIAQEMLLKYPSLVDKDGEYYTVNYSQFTAVLEAQMIKAYKKIDELNKRIASLEEERRIA